MFILSAFLPSFSKFVALGCMSAASVNVYSTIRVWKHVEMVKKLVFSVHFGYDDVGCVLMNLVMNL